MDTELWWQSSFVLQLMRLKKDKDALLVHCDKT